MFSLGPVRSLWLSGKLCGDPWIWSLQDSREMVHRSFFPRSLQDYHGRIHGHPGDLRGFSWVSLRDVVEFFEVLLRVGSGCRSAYPCNGQIVGQPQTKGIMIKCLKNAWKMSENCPTPPCEDKMLTFWGVFLPICSVFDLVTLSNACPLQAYPKASVSSPPPPHHDWRDQKTWRRHAR